MKLETILSIYKINTYGVSTADIKKAIPEVEMMLVDKAIVSINKAVTALNFSELEKEKNNAELNKIAKCNICKMPGKLVTLARNRPVFHCVNHNTINPIPIELIKKLGFDYEPTRNTEEV